MQARVQVQGMEDWAAAFERDGFYAPLAALTPAEAAECRRKLEATE